jgi:hypothetical protein
MHHRGFYKYAVEEELLDHSPAAHVRRPRLDYESHAPGLDRNDRAGCEPPGGPRGDERVHALGLEHQRVNSQLSRDDQALDKTKPGICHAHTFFAPAISRRHLEDQCLTMNTTSHARRA